jgi:acetyl-CoA carboxylase beta subunit
MKKILIFLFRFTMKSRKNSISTCFVCHSSIFGASINLRLQSIKNCESFDRLLINQKAIRLLDVDSKSLRN